MQVVSAADIILLWKIITFPVQTEVSTDSTGSFTVTIHELLFYKTCNVYPYKL